MQHTHREMQCKEGTNAFTDTQISTRTRPYAHMRMWNNLVIRGTSTVCMYDSMFEFSHFDWSLCQNSSFDTYTAQVLFALLCRRHQVKRDRKRQWKVFFLRFFISALRICIHDFYSDLLCDFRVLLTGVQVASVTKETAKRRNMYRMHTDHFRFTQLYAFATL